MGKIINTIKKYADDLLQASREDGLEHTEKIKYSVMQCHQNAGQNHNLMTTNISLENVAEVKYLGMTITNQSYIHKKIKSRLNSGNACHH
jgi:hypothetical protein